MALEDAKRLIAALGAETRHDYPDLEGRTAQFSAFVQDELAALIRKVPPGEVRERLGHIRAQFMGYRSLDRVGRQDLIARLRGALPLLRAPALYITDTPPIQKVATVSANASEVGAELSRAIDPLGGIPIEGVAGVGNYLRDVFHRMGIRTASEVIHYFPRTHLDYSRRTAISDLRAGQGATIWGRIRRCESFTPSTRKNLAIRTLVIADDTGTITARWFAAAASRAREEIWKRRFPAGHAILLSGEVRHDGRSGRLVFERPEAEVLGPGEDEGESLHLGRMVPVYALTEGLGQKAMRRVTHAAIGLLKPDYPDPLSVQQRTRLALVPLDQALRAIHFPDSAAACDVARRRLVFDELFWLQLGLAFKRAQQNVPGNGSVMSSSPNGLVERCLASLPFALTAAQNRVFADIRKDLGRPIPMNRLVQGDVGAGKTVVALLSLLVAVDNGFQGALMAPTEILAEQHFETFKKILAPLKVEVALLLGNQSRKDRQVYLDALREGFCKIAVGTHALIQEGIRFQKLGLVVVDEQHRFGVKQRKQLHEKAAPDGPEVEVLTMTATPIPRTLAMVLYGDLDISAIDELPPGRIPVLTLHLKGKLGRCRAWELVRREVACGRQAYVVFPLVGESEHSDLSSVTEAYERLGASELSGLRVAVLHGQMATADKERIVGSFRKGNLDVLLTTTVIEVGVDVPNATVMVVENAENFGLSQLHQLRGRVGRGAAKSFCLLLSSNASQGATERIETVCATQDGFVIAQRDLELRGPGELIGTKQSGIPDLALANLATDADLLTSARSLAFEIIADDRSLERNPEMLAGMRHVYRQNLDFLGIG